MKRKRINEFPLRISVPPLASHRIHRICCDEKWFVIYFHQVLFVFATEQLSALEEEKEEEKEKEKENGPLYILETSLQFFDVALDNHCLFVLEEPDNVDVYNLETQPVVPKHPRHCSGHKIKKRNKIQGLKKSSQIWLPDWGVNKILLNEMRRGEIEISGSHIVIVRQAVLFYTLYSWIAVFNKQSGVWTSKSTTERTYRRLVFENTVTFFSSFPYPFGETTWDLDSGKQIEFIQTPPRIKCGRFLRNSHSQDRQLYYIDQKFSSITSPEQFCGSFFQNKFPEAEQNAICWAQSHPETCSEELADAAAMPSSLCFVGNKFITCSRGTPRILRFYEFSAKRGRKKTRNPLYK